MASKSKIKGSSYERQVARFLTEQYSAPFMRNISGSGAFVGGNNVHRVQAMSAGQVRSSKGDVVPPDHWTQFNCECKSYSDIAWHQVFSGSCAQLDGWLEQLLAVAQPGDLNILFFKITRRGEWVAVQSGAEWARTCTHVVYRSERHGEWLIFSHNDFFRLNSSILEKYSTAS